MKNIEELLLSLIAEDNRYYFIYSLTDKLFCYANTSFESFFGIRSGDKSINKLTRIVHPDDVRRLKKYLPFLRQGNSLTDFEFRTIRPNEKTYILSLYARIDNSLDKELFLGYVTDITTIKEDIDYLNELNDKKDSILHILLHDLGGPLGNIKNLSRLLNERLKSLNEEDIQKIITSIEKNSKMSIQIINDFVGRQNP